MRIHALCTIGVVILIGCGKSAGGPDAPGGPDDGGPGDLPGHTPGMPGLGAHGMSFFHLGASDATSIATPKLATQASGSTIVVGVGRGDLALFALPTDSAGNAPYRQLDAIHSYDPAYPDSGTGLYAFTSARGGPGFQVTTSTGLNAHGQGDEITMAAIEVIEGTRIQAVAWNEVVQGQTPTPVRSHSVTTTAPATLIAFWWGDAFPGTPQSASPNNGFKVVDSNTRETDSFVQCAVAVKNVTAAGTYDVTWTSTPVQGAQLWLVAVQ